MDNVRALRNELQDLSEFLHRTPSPQVAPIHLPLEQTPVQQSHNLPPQPIGGSPIFPGNVRRLTMTSGQLTRATSSVGSIGSYLSSHYSDDDLLMDGENPDSPPWSLDSSILSTTTSTSGDSDGPYDYYPGSSESSGRPYPPPSLSPSATESTTTIRPMPTPPDLLGPINAIRDQLTALWDGQTSTNHMLDNLRERSVVPPPDHTELNNRIHRIENLLQSLISQRQPAEQPIPQEYMPQPSESIVSSDDGLATIWDALHAFPVSPVSRGAAPAMPVPVTARAGPSVVQELETFAATGQDEHRPIVVLHPPELVPFTYVPTPSDAHPMSDSPVSISDLPPRAATEPPLTTRDVPPRRRPQLRSRRGPAQAAPQQEPPVIPIPVQPSHGAQDVPAAAGDVDFERALQEQRRARHPGTDGTFQVRRPSPPPPVVCLVVKPSLFFTHNLL